MQSLITVYIINALGVHTETTRIDAMSRMPDHATLEAPPAIKDGQCARWNGSSWSVLDEFPVEIDPGPDETAPVEVTRRRGLQALFMMYGLKESDIEAAIVSNITEPNAQYLAMAELKAAQTFERRRELVVMMGTVLNLDLPALFVFAAGLP